MVDRSLAEARSDLDLGAAVRGCYGTEDIAIFSEDGGRGGEEVLTGLLDAALEEANARVSGEVGAHLADAGIFPALSRLDGILAERDGADEALRAVEEADRASAREAAAAPSSSSSPGRNSRNPLLPPGVDPDMVLSYQAHRIREGARDRLAAAVAEVETDVEALRARIARAEEGARAGTGAVGGAGRELGEMADAVGFSGVG